MGGFREFSKRKRFDRMKKYWENNKLKYPPKV